VGWKAPETEVAPPWNEGQLSGSSQWGVRSSPNECDKDGTRLLVKSKGSEGERE